MPFLRTCIVYFDVKLLLNEKLGLSALYPNNIIHLMSTAEVERVFSQVKLVKCDHRNRMKSFSFNKSLRHAMMLLS
jgi:hypothetical protein